VRDKEFIAEVRRHKPSALMPSTGMQPGNGLKKLQRGFGSP
jgi:hypothetical protein